MSTVKVNAITDASGGNTATINSMTPTADSLQGFRNRIINGDMRIDQRNAGASVTPTDAQYTLDRWNAGLTQASKFSVQRSTTAPAGYTNSLLVTSLSAYSVGAGDLFRISQYVEGFNAADLGWGAAGAQSVTLSFWVRSSLTGTFSGSLANSAFNRSYPFTFTINAANTWEQKNVTIAGDTTGTWLTDNGIGIRVGFSLGAGSTYSGTAGAWAGVTYTAATGATSVVGTNGATLYITGVQLEVGSVATPFERRDYGRELMLCQRYCVQMDSSEYLVIGMADTTSFCETSVPLPVQMRTAPTLTTTGTAADYSVREPGTNNNCTSVPVILSAGGQNIAAVRFTASSAFTVGQALYVSGNSGGFLRFEAEL